MTKQVPESCPQMNPVHMRCHQLLRVLWDFMLFNVAVFLSGIFVNPPLTWLHPFVYPEQDLMAYLRAALACFCSIDCPLQCASTPCRHGIHFSGNVGTAKSSPWETHWGFPYRTYSDVSLIEFELKQLLYVPVATEKRLYNNCPKDI